MTAPVALPGNATEVRGDGPSAEKPVVAYIMSRFPKITETFILYEMLAVQEAGIRVELFPLMRERTTVMHPEAAAMLPRARFLPYLSPAILAAQLRALTRHPRAYMGALEAIVRGNWGSPRLLLGALALFPKTVRLAELMQQTRVDHIHAHFATHPAAVALIIHRLTGIPYSFTAHGSDLHVDQHMLREKVAESAAVIAISDYNRDFIIAHCGEAIRQKVVVLHCGVDTAVFENTGRDLRSGTVNLLCTGTLHEVKGQVYLIRACGQLREAGIPFTCRLVGDGPDEAMLAREISSLGLADHVLLLGRRTRQEVADLLRQTDIVIAPSVPTRSGRREGIPVVLMEAMSSGVPVIASAISGIPELVQNKVTGLLVAPRDVDGLAAALKQLCGDAELRARLAAAGRAKVLAEFDIHTNGRTLAQRFREWSSTAPAAQHGQQACKVS